MGVLLRLFDGSFVVEVVQKAGHSPMIGIFAEVLSQPSA
jgi:hypothetical protein